MPEFQIGWRIVDHDTEFVNNGFACAAWSETVLVKAGRYPVMADKFFYHERDKRYTDELADLTIKVVLPGVTVSDNFQAHFCGNPIGSYDNKKNAGSSNRYVETPYSHAVARSILDGKSSIELLPEFEAREIPFTGFDGEQRKTYGIFKIV
ncbi:hypothetical protein OBV_p-00090 (plasmid) [Oscillibacter valericigenes Sjm18-20]|nr:hypothetical protein OBV_p-00090 [Oscillibacter valericigenes Sjm18-20]